MNILNESQFIEKSKDKKSRAHEAVRCLCFYSFIIGRIKYLDKISYFGLFEDGHLIGLLSLLSGKFTEKETVFYEAK